MVCFQLGCVMLCKNGDNFGALPLEATKAWALGKNIPFLIGPNIIKALQGSETRYYQGSIKASKQDLNHLKVPKNQLSCIRFLEFFVEKEVNNLFI
jgi:hypothetical protein